MEVDFVVKSGNDLIAIEVKSGSMKASLAGMEAFSSTFHPKRKLLMGKQGRPFEDFLSQPITQGV